MRDFVLVSEQTALPEVNPSDRVLRGRVTTAEGDPISYANVQVNGGRRYVSDDSGRFAVPITTAGRADVARSAYRFRTGRGEARRDARYRRSHAMMRSVARVLPGQVVTGRAPFARLDLGGFYKRMDEVERGARVGYFVTPEDLELRKPQNVTDAVEQFPQHPPSPDRRRKSVRRIIGDGMPLARKFRIEDRSGCPLTVYLDRVRIQPTMVGAKPVDEEINTLVQPHAVAGIEVYPRAAGAPPEFLPVGQTCGVVVIWSK